jgi:tRNA wybutosine-synthesizing protein 1
MLSVFLTMNLQLQKILTRQHYAIVGAHSGVKLCHWLKQSLLFGRECYKQTFYGINSHRCLQMTPAITHCTQMCLFCWRFQNFTEKEINNCDDPEYILEHAIEAQKTLLSGIKGDPRCDQKKWKEANNPNMLACSLSGEPTLYPKLGEFFELVAPTEELYNKICVPLIPNGWKKIQQTLSLLPSLNTRTVIRHTLVHGWNMDEKYIEAYAKLDQKASPMFIEPKGYVFVGSSRNRLHFQNMPTHDQIKNFGEKLAEKLGYNLIREKSDSFVVLLSSNQVNKKVE